MKLVCTQENLNFSLNMVSHLASRSTNLPILNNVLIKAEQGEIQLITTNLEIGIKVLLRGKIEKEGTFTVNAKLLSDYVNLLPKENVEIETDDGNIKIKCKNYQTQIKGLEATEFPLLPQVEQKQKIVIESENLKEAINQVVFCTALDEARPEINGVLFKIEDKKLILAATDSYRLAEKKVELKDLDVSDNQYIVPLKTVQELQRVLFNQGEKEVIIYFNDNQIMFVVDGIELISRLIEGQYPDYQQIIPTDHKSKAKIKVTELLQAVKSASLFCKPGINDIKLTIIPDKKEMVILASNANLGENITNLPVEIEGEENEIVFNYRFLIDGLNNIGAQQLEFEITSSSTPGLLRPEGNDNYLYIIMPIKQ